MAEARLGTASATDDTWGVEGKACDFTPWLRENPPARGALGLEIDIEFVDGVAHKRLVPSLRTV